MADVFSNQIHVIPLPADFSQQALFELIFHQGLSSGFYFWRRIPAGMKKSFRLFIIARASARADADCGGVAGAVTFRTSPEELLVTSNVHPRENLFCGNLIGLPKIQDLTPEFWSRLHDCNMKPSGVIPELL